MIQKTFSITLDTKRGIIESPIVVVKGDTGNVFHVRVQDDGTDLDLSGADILVAFRGAGGSYTLDGTTGGVTVDGSVVSFPLYRDSVSEGTNSCDIQIYADDVLITTAAFTFECRAATVGEDSIRADASLPVLLELLAMLQNACDKFPEVSCEEIPGGHRITVTAWDQTETLCDVMDGVSGVYVGSGDMPAGYNVQIDPDGSADTFIPEPENEGLSGQVLTTDSLGGRTWESVDYGDIVNKPSINSVTLSGNKTLTEIGAAAASHSHAESDITNLASDLAAKVSEPASEGLSGQVLSTDGAGGRSWITVSGGGGTSDYDYLENKPSINSVELSGNSTSADLSLADASHTHTKSEVTDFPTSLSSFTDDLGSSPVHSHEQYIREHQDISGKADKADLDATKRIVNALWESSKGQIWGFDTETDTAYSVTVPSGSYWVSIDSIGGYSTVANGSIVNSPVTSVEVADSHGTVTTTENIPSAIQGLTLYGCGGCTAYNWVDFENKEYHQEVGITDLGTLTWEYYSTYNGHQLYYTDDLSGTIKCDSKYEIYSLCAEYTSIKNNDYDLMANMQLRVRGGDGRVYLNNDSFVNNVPGLTAALSGVMLQYDLYTPIVTDISGILDDGVLESIEVEEDGTITFVNSNESSIPVQLKYLTLLDEV